MAGIARCINHGRNRGSHTDSIMVVSASVITIPVNMQTWDIIISENNAINK